MVLGRERYDVSVGRTVHRIQDRFSSFFATMLKVPPPPPPPPPPRGLDRAPLEAILDTAANPSLGSLPSPVPPAYLFYANGFPAECSRETVLIECITVTGLIQLADEDHGN